MAKKSVQTQQVNNHQLSRVIDKTPSPEETMATRELIERAINRLNGNQKTFTYSHYIDGKSVKEICQETGKCQTYVNKMLSDAERNLHTFLYSDFPERDKPSKTTWYRR
jgi:DNA-directed RNA polymerase specialized sigma24 family protein